MAFVRPFLLVVLVAVTTVLAVRFEGDEHRQICRTAMQELNEWYPELALKLLKVESLEAQESSFSIVYSGDELLIDVFAEGRKLDRLSIVNLKEGTKHHFDATKTYPFRSSLRVAVYERDWGGIEKVKADWWKDNSEWLGDWLPHPIELQEAHKSGKPITFTINGRDSFGSVMRGSARTEVGGSWRFTVEVVGPEMLKMAPKNGEERVRIKSIKCEKKYEWGTGKDDIYYKVHLDGKKKITNSPVFTMATGQERDIPLEFSYRKSFKLELFEKGLFGKDTLLGEVAWTAGPNGGQKEMHEFVAKNALGLLKYSYVIYFGRVATADSYRSQTVDNGGLDKAPSILTRLKELKTEQGKTIGVTFADVCALGGDFFNGPGIEKDVIGLDVPAMKLRSKREMKKVWKRVISSWFDVDTPAQGTLVSRLVDRFEIERTAIQSRKAAGQPVSLAYGAGATSRDVTDAHNSNFARIMAGEEADHSFHTSSVTMVFWTDQYKNTPYLQAAVYNFDHFLAEDISLNVFKSGHERAIEMARKAHKTRDQGLLRRALAQAAHACHFASDMFAGGHQQVERAELARSAMGLPGAPTLGDGECGENLIKQNQAGGLFSYFQHNEQNDIGVWVANDAGAVWRAYGDKMLNSPQNAKGLAEAVKFAKSAIHDVMGAYDGKCADKTPAECAGERTYKLLPHWKKAPEELRQKEYPRLLVARDGKWWIRKTPFDAPVTDFEKSYFWRFHCAGILSIADVNDLNNAVGGSHQRLQAKEQHLIDLFFKTMDEDGNRHVSLAEFKRWVRKIAPELDEKGNAKRADGVMQKLFDVWPGVSSSTKELTIADLDGLLAVTAHNHNGQGDWNAYMARVLSLDDAVRVFVRAELGLKPLEHGDEGRSVLGTVTQLFATVRRNVSTRVQSAYKYIVSALYGGVKKMKITAKSIQEQAQAYKEAGIIKMKKQFSDVLDQKVRLAESLSRQERAAREHKTKQ